MVADVRQAARITLFLQDSDGTLEPTPDLEVLYLLLRQVPIVSQNPDGSRTFVFDVADPWMHLDRGAARDAPTRATLLAQMQAIGNTARALGMPLTAALAESAAIVAESEMPALPRTTHDA
jgi:hypothetical protein